MPQKNHTNGSLLKNRCKLKFAATLKMRSFTSTQVGSVSHLKAGTDYTRLNYIHARLCVDGEAHFLWWRGESPSTESVVIIVKVLWSCRFLSPVLLTSLRRLGWMYSKNHVLRGIIGQSFNIRRVVTNKDICLPYKTKGDEYLSYSFTSDTIISR